MYAVACVLVRTPRVFERLKHRSVLQWVAAALIEVRGLDCVNYVVDAKLADRLRAELRDAALDQIVPIPKRLADVSDDALWQWCRTAECPAPPADTVMLGIGATTPYLPAAKMEECLLAVQNPKTPRVGFAATVLDLPIVAPRGSGLGRVTKGTAFVEVLGCRAYGVDVVDLAAHEFAPVLVSLTEALDVRHTDQWRLAQGV